MKKRRAAFALIAILIGISLSSRASAVESELELFVTTRDQSGIAKVINRGNTRISGVFVSVELRSVKQLIAEDIIISPGEVRRLPFVIEFPEVQGSYPLITTVSYLSHHKRLSFKDVGTYHYGIKRTFQPTCFSSDIGLSGSRSIGLSCRGRTNLLVVAPDEVLVSLAGKEGFPQHLLLSESIAPHNLRSPIFFVETRTGSDGYHAVAVQKRWLTVSSQFNVGSPIPLAFLLLAVVAGMFMVLRYWPSAEQSGGLSVCIVRWAWSLVIVSLGLLFVQEGSCLSVAFFTSFSRNSLPEHWGFDIPWWIISTIVQFLSFDDENYAYFRHYFAYPIFLYFVFCNSLTLRYLVRPDPLNDKYWQCMKAFLKPLDRRVVSYNVSQAKIAARALLVKFIFAPLLLSWSVNNFSHAAFLLSEPNWSPLSMHMILLHLLITLDVGVFACGYITELPQLKNTVKSVEPTMLGWFVCLVCYPPLNEFFFIPFDHPVASDLWVAPAHIQQFALIPILLLWIVYVWSSLSLGFKASNLTNRGVVTRGPYRYLRHPAYASKVVIWIIEGVILGKYYLALCCSFIIIYFLRAWTEERHLMSDPDYIAYRERVPNRFFPRFW